MIKETQAQTDTKNDVKARSNRFLIAGLLMTSALLEGQVAFACGAGIAKSTVYFLPDVVDYCKSSKPCPKFKKAVAMQGSGRLPGNRVLKYNGKTLNVGSCSTTTGARGDCLLPYVSIAADPRFYSIGDIIQMPALAGKQMSLPDGRELTHPGYFIVHDVGAWIKGENRFDFFTGTYNQSVKGNAFGQRGLADIRMVDKNECSPHKKFSVIRRNSDQWQVAMDAITESQTRPTHGNGMSVRGLASIGGSR